MKINNLKRGFTLIELLVVIAIIGILATGAVGVYTTQLQKARDSQRISDMEQLRGAIEQFYADANNYPVGQDFLKGPNKTTTVEQFLQRLPKDPRSGQGCIGTRCGIAYTVGSDDGHIAKGAYELSIGFENKGNHDSKAVNTNDRGDDNERYEHFARNSELKTVIPISNATNFNGNGSASSDADGNKILIIEGNEIKLAN